MVESAARSADMSDRMAAEDACATMVIGAAIEVHRHLGLILNFHESLMRDGVCRVINDPDRQPPPP